MFFFSKKILKWEEMMDGCARPMFGVAKFNSIKILKPNLLSKKKNTYWRQ